METRDIIRRCRFTPYRKGMGPTFALTMWDTGRHTGRGMAHTYTGYRLTMHMPGAATMVLFEGEDYSRGAGDSEDGDATVNGIMTFLTLRPGDTDADYFRDYTDDQLAYCSAHAEALSCEVQARFCDENGNVRKSA